MSPFKRTVQRRGRDRKAAAAFLKALIEGARDAYECYRGLYLLWCSNNGALMELKPLFRMDGVEANGTFSVDDRFRSEIKSLAKQILPLLSETKDDRS
jgi:hypothetical protein